MKNGENILHNIHLNHMLLFFGDLFGFGLARTLHNTHAAHTYVLFNPVGMEDRSLSGVMFCPLQPQLLSSFLLAGDYYITSKEPNSGVCAEFNVGSGLSEYQ